MKAKRMSNKPCELKPVDLVHQFILVEGEQGVGKTAELVAFCRAMFKKLNKELMKETTEYTNMLNKKYGYNLKLSKHCFFSNFDITLDSLRNIHTHYIDMARLGLPNMDFNVQYFPRGSVIVIQEASLLAYCRDFKTMNKYLISLIRYFRHWKLTVIFDCQTIEDMDKALRKLVVWDYYIDYRVRHRFLFFRPKYIWHFYRIRNQLANRLASLTRLGIPLNIPIVQECIFKYRGEIHDYYDSFEAAPYYLKDIKQYEFLKHPSKNLDRKSVDAYVSAHPLVNEENKKGD